MVLVGGSASSGSVCGAVVGNCSIVLEAGGQCTEKE